MINRFFTELLILLANYSVSRIVYLDTMHEEKVTRAFVTETHETPYAVAIEVSGYHIKGDEPESVGGGNLGPAPYDILLAALGECTAMTVRWFAIQRNWPLDKVSVVLTHHKEKSSQGLSQQDVFTKKIILEGPALTQDQRLKLIEIAAKCPVQRTLEGTPIIHTTQ